MTAFEFEIENIVLASNSTYVEAVVEYGEIHKMDEWGLLEMLQSSKPIMSKLAAESKRLGLLRNAGKRRGRESSLDRI